MSLRSKGFMKICFICCIVLILVALGIMALSLFVILSPGEGTVIEASSFIVPAVCLVVAVLGFAGAKHYKKLM